MQKLIRLVATAGISALIYIVADMMHCIPTFFLFPCILSLVHMLLWDVLKIEALESGFFRFLKFVIFLGAAVLLTFRTFTQSLALMTPALFALESTASDILMQSIGGAIAMMAFAFVFSLGCVQSFPNRWVGLAVAPLSVVAGLIYGFLPAFFGMMGIGIGKFFAWVILALPIIVLFAYIKENGLVYNDLGYDDAFAGLGFKKRGGYSGGGTMTAPISEPSGPAPTWRDWQYIAKCYSGQQSLSYGAVYVDVQYSNSDRSVEFYIDAQYEINGVTEQYQVDNSADEVRSILADVQQSVFSDAQDAANGHVRVSVRVRNVRAR